MCRELSHGVPGDVDANGDLVFDRDGEERRTIDFEVGAGERNGPGDAHRVAL